MAYSDASRYITPANRFEILNLRFWIEKTSYLTKRITRIELVEFGGLECYRYTISAIVGLVIGIEPTTD